MVFAGLLVAGLLVNFLAAQWTVFVDCASHLINDFFIRALVFLGCHRSPDDCPEGVSHDVDVRLWDVVDWSVKVVASAAGVERASLS